MHSANDECPSEVVLTELGSVRVLVVEDAWHVATALRGLLEGLGMTVVGPAATILDAERLLAAQIPQVAVVDVNLKGEMAYGLIDRLNDSGVPVIVVSGYAVLPSLTDKAIVILQKPFNGPDLVAALQQAIGSARR